MATGDRQDIALSAVRVARLYYFQNMTTAAIAEEMGTSRATVSRLLSYAMEKGLVEIRVHDPQEFSGNLEASIRAHYPLRSVQVVPVPATGSESDNMQRVAAHTAAYLNTLVQPSTVIGLAWGKTVAAIADNLSAKSVHGVEVVQLNGSGSGTNIVNTFGESIVTRFAQNYGARAHSLPVPAFFDYADTRTALWRERSIKAIRELQDNATILLFSIGTTDSGSYSHIHTAGYLDQDDLDGIRKDGVIADIATVFFRADGSWRDIALNARSSGPDLDRFQHAAHAICVVSGKSKIAGLRAALHGGYINELMIDEPTARLLVQELEQEANSKQDSNTQALHTDNHQRRART
ncbi:DNA-binding transcriptional regulator LsrR (DeoR family) [Herbaspirillum sp. Sphag1AN]|uniref:sugar-binding transcriptional regulator n=1 Tax=unclassified Herbaspirillum TaxID=2624150 RepID=UPI001610654D|nr:MULTISPECIES: sugar-binding transcriptional regulator [unclassified Herbaspirillum]MBB3213329.1 DNA-binding transcriptional regulator LsrR (DeoR family) [Herbaspirillum sp. Sphag1AN]MBB3246627.1 DNA-binding transcriptional regulator LsrR (DeoR family) [Herbaspirillum sp. Sphag64]